MFAAYDGPLQYAMFQTNTDVGHYAERKNNEGTINGKFVVRLFESEIYIHTYYQVARKIQKKNRKMIFSITCQYLYTYKNKILFSYFNYVYLLVPN